MICCDCVHQVLHITTVMYEVTLNLLLSKTLNEGLVWVRMRHRYTFMLNDMWFVKLCCMELEFI